MNHLTGDDYTGFIIKVNEYYIIIELINGYNKLLTVGVYMWYSG